MTPREATPKPGRPLDVLAAALLFNLGQGVLRPSLPMFLRAVFAANYRMVTLIPVVFGAGRWLATLPTGYVLDAVGRRAMMVAGLLVVAVSDVGCAMILVYAVFLGLRALAGAGWAMFGTVATTVMVDRTSPERRGRAISALLMSETLGLLLGSAAGGWVYQRFGAVSPFLFEAACMAIAALLVASHRAPLPDPRPVTAGPARRRGDLRSVLRVPGVVLMSVTGAILTAVYTGVVVFLFPLYLTERGGLGPAAVGHVVSLGVLGRLLGLYAGGALSDRRGRMAVLVPGLVGYGMLIAGVALSTNPLVLAVCSFLLGAVAGLVAPLPTAVVGDRVAGPSHGVAIGWLRTVADTGMLAGPLLMGALADWLGLAAPFVAAGVLMGAVAWGCHRGATAVARAVPS